MNKLVRRLVVWWLRRQPPVRMVCRFTAEHLFVPNEVVDVEHTINAGDLVTTGEMLVTTTFHGLGPSSLSSRWTITKDVAP